MNDIDVSNVVLTVEAGSEPDGPTAEERIAELEAALAELLDVLAGGQ